MDTHEALKSRGFFTACWLVVIFCAGCGVRQAVTSLRSPAGSAVEQNAAAVAALGLPDYCSARIEKPAAGDDPAVVPGPQVCIDCLPAQVPRRGCFSDIKPDFDPARDCRKEIEGARHVIRCARSPGSGFTMDLRPNRAELLHEKLPAAIDLVEAFLNAKLSAEPDTEVLIVQVARAGLKIARAHGRQVLEGKDLDLAAASCAREMGAIMPGISDAELAGIEPAAKKSFANLAGVVAEGKLTASALLPAVAPLADAIPALNHLKFLLIALLDKDGAKVIEAAISPYSPEIVRKLSALLGN